MSSSLCSAFSWISNIYSGLVLRVLVALYGLRQAAYELYMLILSLLLDLGMVRCEVDHGIFFGEWTSSPDPSVPLPPDGSPLVLFVPLHIDDGLAITNSPLLYAWFLSVLSQRLHIVDLGPCAKFLNILIIRDRPKRRLWLSSHVYIAELLTEWNLSTCRPASTPFPSLFPDLSLAPSNSLPVISNADLLSHYQRLVGCLLYIAITTRPDFSYYAMWLGQFNASPTRAHFLLTKHVLLPVHILWLYVLVLPLHVSCLLSVDISRIWDAQMLTGLLMWSIGRVFLDIFFISRALRSLGLRLNKNRLLSLLLRLNTMLWLMR